MSELPTRGSVFVLTLLLLLGLSMAVGFPEPAAAQSSDGGEDPNVIIQPGLFETLEYRLAGPHRGGRSTAVTGVPGDPFRFFQGTTGGGVWVTADAGESWKNISDGFIEVGSIGAVEVALSDANVIYVGTGSACIRGNVSAGDGVYRSTDGGRTWSLVGLEESGAVGSIQVHPSNPDLVYVAALGHPFGKNPERGVFRSSDGGETWEHVLALSDSVGAVDLVMNPENPRILFAGMWRGERKPWTLVDASEDGGVYRSTDGGDTWEKLEKGLPTGLIGRIGVAVSPANPDRIWAQVNAHDPQGGIYRSDDGGDSWTRVNRNRKLRQRAWYYSHLVADPQDENTLYAMNTSLYRSIDGGRTFQPIRVPHGDVHDLWVNPDNPNLMVVADDGGAQVSLNHGESWSTLLNQPTAELYRVTVDNQFPYRIYAAQQDNSTISLPSRPAGGLTPSEEWFGVGGCESGHIAVDPRDPNVAYAGCYIGEITRINRRTGENRNVMPYPVLVDGVAPRDLAYRFQWNAPIHFSPHDPQTLYATSNVVHRTRDEGMTWEVISPDLTADDESKQDFPGGPLQHDHTSVEVYGTIFAFVESPHTPGVLWTGSDDGKVHLSRDDGGTWTDVTPHRMPEDATVNTLEVSPHHPGRVYLAVQRYRMDDFTPYVYRTDNYGATWDLLTDGENGIPGDHPVRVVREDPDREGLLYAGTEFGLFASFDAGEHWQSFRLNLPVTPVSDLQVFRQNLVVATQGRSLWILDDLAQVHQLGSEVEESAATLFQPGTTYRMRGGRGGGDRAAQGPPGGAVIRYYLAEKPEGEVTLEILDSQGEQVRLFSSKPKEEDDQDDGGDPELPAKKGVNRFVWNLTHEPLDLPEGAMAYLGYTGGATALPGRYTLRLTVGEESQSQTLQLLKDPRLEHITQVMLEEQFEVAVRVRGRMNETYQAIRTIRSVREQSKEIGKRAKEGGFGGELLELADTLAEKVKPIEEKLIQTKAESGQDPINFPPQLDNQLGYLYRQVNGAYGPPTAAEMARLAELEGVLAGLVERLEEVLALELARFNAKVTELGVPGVVVPTADERRYPPTNARR